jgi:hypothetical protein
MTFHVLGLANRKREEFNQILKIYKLSGRGRGERKSVCVCVCVCVREREREKERKRKIDTLIDSLTDIQTD